MAKELVMRENVDVIVGTINSAAALAISEAVAKKEKVPFIVWISKSEKITGELGHRYVFSTAENTAMAGKAGGRGAGEETLQEVLDRRQTTMSTAMPLPMRPGGTSRR